MAGCRFLAADQDRHPRESTDNPTQSQALPNRSQTAGGREEFPQSLHGSYLLSGPVRPRLIAATILEVKIEQRPMRVRITSPPFVSIGLAFH